MLEITNKHRYNCFIVLNWLLLECWLCVLEICTFCPSETLFQKQHEFKITRTWSKRKYAECLHKSFACYSCSDVLCKTKIECDLLHAVRGSAPSLWFTFMKRICISSFWLTVGLETLLRYSNDSAKQITLNLGNIVDWFRTTLHNLHILYKNACDVKAVCCVLVFPCFASKYSYFSN